MLVAVKLIHASRGVQDQRGFLSALDDCLNLQARNARGFKRKTHISAFAARPTSSFNAVSAMPFTSAGRSGAAAAAGSATATAAGAAAGAALGNSASHSFLHLGGGVQRRCEGIGSK